MGWFALLLIVALAFGALWYRRMVARGKALVRYTRTAVLKLFNDRGPQTEVQVMAALGHASSCSTCSRRVRRELQTLVRRGFVTRRAGDLPSDLPTYAVSHTGIDQLNTHRDKVEFVSAARVQPFDRGVHDVA